MEAVNLLSSNKYSEKQIVSAAFQLGALFLALIIINCVKLKLFHFVVAKGR